MSVLLIGPVRPATAEPTSREGQISDRSWWLVPGWLPSLMTFGVSRCGIGLLFLELVDGHADRPVRPLLLPHQADDLSGFALDGKRGAAFGPVLVLESGLHGGLACFERLLPVADARGD